MKYGLLITILITSLFNYAQVTVTGSTGVNGNYTSLSNAGGAFVTLNGAGVQTGNNITITITADITTEMGANNLNGHGWASLQIIPLGNRIISGSGGVDIIELNNTNNVTINGINNGSNSLTISNASTNGSAYAITLNNLATNNTITNCTVTGSNAGVNGAIVFFNNSAAGIGTSNNIISNCILNAASTTLLPTNGIFSNGSATGKNSNNKITNCKISNYFNATISSSGIKLSTDNDAWIIDSCNFFQTAARTSSSGSPTHSAINIANTSGDKFTIRNNTIGGDNATGTGYSDYGPSGTTHFYKAIILNNTGPIIAAIPSSSLIYNNLIRGIKVASGSTVTTTGNNIFVGIEITNGTTTDSVICRKNIIGGTTGIDSIILTTSATSANNACVGILHRSTRGNVIDSNTIGAINMNNASSTRTTPFVGIKGEGTSSSQTTQVRSNIIGNPTAANIQSNHSGIGGQLVGIQLGLTGTSSIYYIEKNTIQNFTHTALNTGTGSSACIIGISISSLSGDATTINNNLITKLANTGIGASAIEVYGIRYTSPTGAGAFTGIVKNNTIQEIDITTSTSINSKCVGIQSVSGNNHHIFNNMVSLGSNSPNGQLYGYECAGATVKLYNNTIRIYGTGTTVSAALYRSNNNAFDCINNIFYNNRTGGPSHFSSRLTALSASLAYTGNNNIYQPNTINPIGFIAITTYATLAAYTAQVATTSSNSEGAASKEATISFFSTTNLHMFDLDVIRAGQNLFVASPAIVTDIDGEARSSTCLPSIGADEVFFHTIGNRNTWVGTSNTRWCEPCNWDKANVPTNTTSAFINAGNANYPLLNTAAACGITQCDSLTISRTSGAILSQPGGILDIYGSFYNTSGTTYSDYNGGAVRFLGTGNEEINALANSLVGFSNAVFNNTGITTLNNCSLGVSSTLTLTSGLVTMTANQNIVVTSVSGGSNSAYIATPFSSNYFRIFDVTNSVNKLIPIGPSTTSYNPLILNNQPTNKRFDFTVNTGINPAISFPLNAINRTWKIVPEAPVPSAAIDITFQYSDVDANAGCSSTATMELGGYAPTVWNVVSSPYQSTPTGSAIDRQVSFPVINWVDAYAIGNIGSILSVNNQINIQISKTIQGASILWNANIANGIQYYDIEKSEDGIQFTVIHTTVTNLQNKYNYVDIFASFNKVYYRIKAHQTNGGTIYSPIRIFQSNTITNIKLIPTIVTNNTTLYFYSNITETAIFNIVNANGRMIITKKVYVHTGQQQIDFEVSTLPSGIYFVQSKDVYIKFIKE